MINDYNLLSPEYWKDYELIDSGAFEKLERFGQFILSRPEPQALWDKKRSQKEWDDLWHARYHREKGRSDLVLNSEKGSWEKKPGMKDKWSLNYKSPDLNLTFNLSLTSFGHIGVFPEQAVNWSYIYNSVKQVIGKKTGYSPKVLNLFAYTGGASLAACAAGAEVVHVDSVKQVVNWAAENKTASHLDGIIRWVVEDALKFVIREGKRGNVYQGIILDPPAYGRGPAGEKWLLERNLNEMMKYCAQLLDKNHHFLLLNTYSMGISPVIMDSLTEGIFPGSNREAGELIVSSGSGVRLPLGAFVRFLK